MLRRPSSGLQRLAAAFIAAASSVSAVGAADISVAAGEPVQAVIDRAAPGDVLRLGPGRHGGPVVIAKPLVLEGAPGAEIVGPERGSVVQVSAPDVRIVGLTIRGSGRVIDGPDSGIFLSPDATRAVVENNRILGNLYGVYVRGAADSLVRGNVIEGFTEGRSSDAGNGITVWNAPGARAIGNTVRYGRDGIFVSASRKNVFSDNRFENLRFAIHYMYTNDSEVSGNVSTGNRVGYALMYSHRIVVRGNVSDGDRDHGLLFNYANNSVVESNAVIARVLDPARWMNTGTQVGDTHGVPASDADETGTGARAGPEKCVFIYNANGNRFRNNWFEGCGIGVHFTAGSERNEITGNAFVRNRNQVKYVGTRYLEWSADGRGNFWSDNPAFDLDGDGIADNAYRPNGLVDRVLWMAPQAKVLMNSPAVQVIKWAQSQFPALLPGGVTDSHPLMVPPARTRPTGAPS